MARLDLSDDERELLASRLRGIISADRFPLSPRIRGLRAILQKLDQPPTAPEPYPPPKPPGDPSRALKRRRQRD